MVFEVRRVKRIRYPGFAYPFKFELSIQKQKIVFCSISMKLEKFENILKKTPFKFNLGGINTHPRIFKGLKSRFRGFLDDNKHQITYFDSTDSRSQWVKIAFIAQKMTPAINQSKLLTHYSYQLDAVEASIRNNNECLLSKMYLHPGLQLYCLNSLILQTQSLMRIQGWAILKRSTQPLEFH